MRISLAPPAPEKLERLEAAAAARPGLYRAWLVLLALTGDAILTFVRVLPFAGPIAFGAFFVNNAYVYLLATAAILLLIWVMRPGRRDSGESLARADAPELYGVLDDLKTRLDVGRRLDVRLEDEVNAGAREARGLFGLLGTRRVLTLGVPLLALLGKDEARAIIAHEFGHFSRRHGRLGHWLYWAHFDWLWHAAQIDHESSILDRAGAVVAEMFAPAFSRRAMVWSRRCEYEADADAARAVGGAPLVGALARLDVFSAWEADEFPRIVRSWQCAEPAAPHDWLQRMIAAFEATPPDVLAKIAAAEAARAGDWSDTHPRLAKRAAALGVKPGLAPREEASGAALLGGLWPKAAADYNARWRTENAAAWSAAHARHRLIEAPLLAAEPATVAGWPIAQRLARAAALRRSEPARGLAELAALSDAAPEDRSVTFAYAAARLTEGDAGAVETMIALAKADARWRVPACARLVRHHERIGDRTGAARWADQLDSVGEREARIHASACDGLAAGTLTPTTRAAPFIETLRAGFAAEPTLAKAWLVETKAPNAATLRIDVLILVVDPVEAMQQPIDADDVADRHRQVLADMIEPDTLPVVMPFYSTEPLPTALQAALDKLPVDGAYVR